MHAPRPKRVAGLGRVVEGIERHQVDNLVAEEVVEEIKRHADAVVHRGVASTLERLDEQRQRAQRVGNGRGTPSRRLQPHRLSLHLGCVDGVQTC